MHSGCSRAHHSRSIWISPWINSPFVAYHDLGLWSPPNILNATRLTGSQTSSGGSHSGASWTAPRAIANGTITLAMIAAARPRPTCPPEISTDSIRLHSRCEMSFVSASDMTSVSVNSLAAAASRDSGEFFGRTRSRCHSTKLAAAKNAAVAFPGSAATTEYGTADAIDRKPALFFSYPRAFITSE